MTTRFQSCDSLYCTILNDIDKWKHKIGMRALNNIRYGLDKYIPWEDWDNMLVYKSILTKMLYCSDCFCDADSKDVINKIRKIINQY